MGETNIKLVTAAPGTFTQFVPVKLVFISNRQPVLVCGQENCQPPLPNPKLSRGGVAETTVTLASEI